MRRLANNIWDDKQDCYNGAEEDMETAPPAKRKPGNRYKNQVKIDILINSHTKLTFSMTHNLDIEFLKSVDNFWHIDDFSLCR